MRPANLEEGFMPTLHEQVYEKEIKKCLEEIIWETGCVELVCKMEKGLTKDALKAITGFHKTIRKSVKDLEKYLGSLKEGLDEKQ